MVNVIRATIDRISRNGSMTSVPAGSSVGKASSFADAMKSSNLNKSSVTTNKAATTASTAVSSSSSKQATPTSSSGSSSSSSSGSAAKPIVTTPTPAAAMTDADKRFAGLLPPLTSNAISTPQAVKAAEQARSDAAWIKSLAATPGTKYYEASHPALVTNKATGLVTERYNIGGGNYVDINPKTAEVVQSMSKVGGGLMVTPASKMSPQEIMGLTAPILQATNQLSFIGGGVGIPRTSATTAAAGETVQTAAGYSYLMGAAPSYRGLPTQEVIKTPVYTEQPIGAELRAQRFYTQNYPSQIGSGLVSRSSVGPRYMRPGFVKANKLKDFAGEFFSRKWGGM